MMCFLFLLCFRVFADNCDSISNQKICESQVGDNGGIACLWKLGFPPKCIPDFLQCEIYGKSNCHLDPACFINEEGKCVFDSCIESDFIDGNPLLECSNSYCKKHTMYDYDDVSENYYNWSICTDPNNEPNPCFYLGYYERAADTYTFKTVVCESSSSCQKVDIYTPFLFGNYCTDGRTVGSRVYANDDFKSNTENEGASGKAVVPLLIVILVIVVVGIAAIVLVIAVFNLRKSQSKNAAKELYKTVEENASN